MRILIVKDEVRRHTESEELPPVEERETIIIEQRESIGFALIFLSPFVMYQKRTVPGLVLMSTRTFLHNAVLFTYGLVLTSYYSVSSGNGGLYLAPSPSATSRGRSCWGACSIGWGGCR